ncbi:hypothetical protein [Nonomuraea sp. NPDC050310]|uniref:hypothetical protein n=1 Tax=Nonomuraea sp. NPDC050310 TaxID=3154935 RepID=UPI0033EF4AE5
MSLSDVIRSITKTITDKEKVKEIPLAIIQGTLSAAGQALLVVDRVKNSIKGLGQKEEEQEETVLEVEESKPRREPVIFAPRPAGGAAESNGTGSKEKAEPVIFSPAPKKEETPEPAAPTATVSPAETPAPAAEASKAEPAKPAEPVEPAKTAEAVEPVVSKADEAQAVEPVETVEPKPEPEAEVKPVAKPKAAATKAEGAAKAKAPAKPRASAASKAAKPAPAAEGGELATAVHAVESTLTEEPKRVPADLAEPLPGYATLTVASLRARMRGKTPDQLRELLAYEQATSARADVVKMFENRLAKLETAE